MQNAFTSNTALTSVTIGRGLTTLSRDVFSWCQRLASVTIPSIGHGAFSHTDLASLTIGNGVTTIGNFAFYGCDKLTSVVIPDGVTSIGW